MASSQEMGNNYIYFFFSEIDFDLFYRQFNQKYKFEDKDVALKFYDDWFVVFDKRRYVFYRAQYKQHFELVQNAFSIQYNIPIDESPSVYGLEEHWRKFKIENGLDSHRDKLDRLEERNKHREEEARQRSNIPKSYSLPELHERFSEIFSDVAAGNRPSTKEINTFWFNTTISNGKEKIKSLKELPYTEYLATTHWQRVRSAMLLIHGARCQEESCYQMFLSCIQLPGIH